MELKPFQIHTVNWMVDKLEKRKGVYNACEQGLGKSAMALSSINKLEDIKSTLIICPAIVRFVWAHEIEKWSNKKSSFMVASYNEAQMHTQKFKILPFQCLILDEAHMIKNHTAKRTKAILNELWPLAKYKICLSGTPMTLSIADCWTTFSRLAPEDFRDWYSFVHTYTNVKRTAWGDRYEGVKNEAHLKNIIRKKFFIRHKKKDVLDELPAKIWQVIPLDKSYKVELSKEDEEAQQAWYKLLAESYTKKIPLRTAPPVAIATINRLQGLKKVKPVAEFCKNLLDQNQAIVVFVYHKDVSAALARELKKYNPAIVTGETAHLDRKKAVDEYETGQTNLFLGTIGSCGMGITLVRGSVVVFGEMSWSPSEIAQATDRVHRIGQVNSVNCYTFSVADSLDEKINEVLIRKSRAFSKVLE